MIYLQMDRFLIDLGGACAEDGSGRRGVVVGRDPARRGEGPAGGSPSAGPTAGRLGADGADRGAVGAATGRCRPSGWAGTADDRDRDLRAVDDRQAPLRLGLPDADARGVGLDPSATVLPD